MGGGWKKTRRGQYNDDEKGSLADLPLQAALFNSLHFSSAVATIGFVTHSSGLFSTELISMPF